MSREKMKHFALSTALAFVFFLSCAKVDEGDKYNNLEREPHIFPDYSGIVVPPNIAPLNFEIEEEGTAFRVEMYGDGDNKAKIVTFGRATRIPLHKWKDLLSRNRGKGIHFDVYRTENGREWDRFSSIINTVATEKIDNYLSYRLITPLFILWKDIGIYQRDLTSFSEKRVLTNYTLDKACLNCHHYCANSAERMILHMRKGPGTSMLMVYDGEVRRIDTRTEFNSSAAAYPSWYPDGSLLAFSVNKVQQYFHGVGENRSVFDWASDLIVYDIASNTVTTTPEISRPDQMETYPCWSPEGDYLYFCSAPQVASDIPIEDQYPDVRYSLKRVAYDARNRVWGTVETVLSSSAAGRSISQPRISPDGRFMLFCMADYGNFPVYNPSSDLYLLDLHTGEYFLPPVNSSRSDSFHSWSSNSRWFVFSSKRMDGLHARPYFSYIDETGKAHKPFVLPQKNPDFYKGYLKTFNLPELTKDPVTSTQRELSRVARDTKHLVSAALDPSVRPGVHPQGEDTPWLPAR
jgi:hypothetical protein